LKQFPNKTKEKNGKINDQRIVPHGSGAHATIDVFNEGFVGCYAFRCVKGMRTNVKTYDNIGRRDPLALHLDKRDLQLPLGDKNDRVTLRIKKTEAV
jgi:hypothetical protein